MPSILNLKFKGNKSFIAFSNLGDTDSLTRTWKVCTKVAGYLEQGQRLENLSWRLWHLQNLMVDTDNAKSKREFKKLSKTMGDKLDKEKGRSIEELQAPGFKRTGSTDLLVQRAAEKERSREAQQGARPGTIKRMQFTFAVDGPHASAPAAAHHVDKPDLKPSAAFRRTGPRAAAPAPKPPASPPPQEEPLTQRGRKPSASGAGAGGDDEFAALRFPSYFGTSDFGPAALLYSPPTLAHGNSYGEGPRASGAQYDAFAISRPTIELGIDELMADTPPAAEPETALPQWEFEPPAAPDTPMPEAPAPAPTPVSAPAPVKAAAAPAPKPALQVRTGAVPAPGGQKAECSNCGATHTPLWRRGLNDELNCNACGLYCKLHKRPRPKTMRGQPAHARHAAQAHSADAGPSASASSSSAAANARYETHEPIPVAQCYNCHTTATPLWRKDEEGKTVCNACGLYYKLHGAARPISMKSDVIRKRSRHDARRGGAPGETPSASPGASRRASPHDAVRSPTLAPDSSTAPVDDRAPVWSGAEYAGLMYGYPAPDFALGHAQDDAEAEEEERAAKRRRLSTASSTFSAASGISSASGTEPPSSAISSASYATTGTAASSLASESGKPYDYAEHNSNAGGSSGFNGDNVYGASAGYDGGSSQYQHDGGAVYGPADFPGARLEFPFSAFPTYGMLRAPGARAWHPPLLPPAQSPTFVHPPMIPPEDALALPSSAYPGSSNNNASSSNNGGRRGSQGGMDFEWTGHHPWAGAGWQQPQQAQQQAQQGGSQQQAQDAGKGEAPDENALFSAFLQSGAGVWEGN